MLKVLSFRKLGINRLTLVVFMLLVTSLFVSANEETAPTITQIGTVVIDDTITLDVETDEDSTCKFSKQDEDYNDMGIMSTTGGMTHSNSEIFSTSSSGVYYIRCQDVFGNTMTSSASTTFNIVIEVPAPVESASEEPVAKETPEEQQGGQSQTSTARSGGGGSKRNTGATTFLLGTVKKDEVKELGLNKKAIAVNKVSFTAKKDYTAKLDFGVKRIYEFPDKKMNQFPTAHSFFEINAQNINELNFKDFKITFSVENAWLTVNKIKENQVSLYRYKNEQWTEYKTTKIDPLEKHKTTYVATVPGFSYFAIDKSGVKVTKSVQPMQKTQTKTQSEKKEIVENVTETINGVQEDTETIIEEAQDEIIAETAKPKKINYAYLIIGILAILLIAFLIVKPKNN